ncbi:hypothetical protein NL676_010948 [Syzygium grande]|nr:hypothetical protein NL676_010948 [Syzygium grande]
MKMASFPDNITVDILLRLPVKSLARFRCMCKSWKSLLAIAYFVKAHLDRSSKFRTVDLLKYNDNNSTKIGATARIAVSYLILILPSVIPIDMIGHLDDFKVVSISFYIGAHPDHHSSEAQIYSLRSNSWKKIGNSFPSWLDKNLGHQVVFQNFICWRPYACIDGQIITPFVLLDTIEEVFREMGLPESMPSEEKFITSFDGCLSLILQNPSSQCYKVWTMKEFGVTESWTKLYTTTVFTNGFLQCWPLGATSFGEVLFVKCFYFGLRFCLPSYVVSYDARRSEFEEFKVEVDSDFSSQFIPYVESLVSVLGVPKCGFRTRPVLDPPEKQTGGSMIKWAKSRFHKLRTSLSYKVFSSRMESNPL